MTRWLLVLLYFAFELLIDSRVAVGFPINTRYNYNSCATCHVSPSGGGILTDYGRATAGEFLSTWSYEREESVGHGIFREDPPVFKLGGDFRYIHITNETPDVTLRRNFFMQQDLEVAISLGKEVTLVGLVGYYGEQNEKPEFRRNYLLLTPADWVSARVGRFYPAFGILNEDHTAATRKYIGFDQGMETYNAELSLRNEYGELFVTGIFGNAGQTEFGNKQGYVFSTQEKGGAVKASYFFGTNKQVAVSYLQTRDLVQKTQKQIYGVSTMLGLYKNKIYSMAESDYFAQGPEGEKLPKPILYTYTLLGWELYRGIHVQLIHEQKNADEENSVKLQWFPRPHFEITAQFKQTEAMGQNTTLLFHYYL